MSPSDELQSFASAPNEYDRLVAYVREYAIFSTDAAGVIRSWNEGVSRVFGFQADEFVGRHVRLIFTEEDASAGVPERELEDADIQGETTDDRWLRRRSGQRFWASGITTAIRDRDGALIGFSKILRDLTDRKLAEEAIRSSEERMQLAAAAAQFGTWDYDPESHTLKLDARSRELFHLDAAEAARPEMVLAGIDAAWREGARRSIGLAFDPAIGQCDVEAPTVDVPPRWIRATGRAYFNEERAVRFVGTVQDVTLRKRAEQERDALLERERVARTEAERANQLKDEFLATLSHELRTPLNALLGFVRLLQSGRMGADSHAHALSVIERNALTLKRLIEDIFDTSRMLRGLMHLDVHTVDFGAIVTEAIDVVRPAVAAKGLQLRWTRPTAPVLVLGDADRLRQILGNLLSNAVRFTPGKGAIDVILRTADEIQLEIRDTGVGIHEAFLPHVFEPFRQADASPSREHGGLGLGLSIVRKLVELHGGSVVAESEGRGRGATFTVRLPVPSQDPQTRDAPLRTPDASGRTRRQLEGMRILIVDDDPDALELLRLLLEQCGAQVTVSTSGERALAELTRTQPHVLISDLGMPVMDGLQLIRTVRATHPTLPAIAVTAYASSDDATAALRAGYHAHLSKPLDPDTVCEHVLALRQKAPSDSPLASGSHNTAESTSGSGGPGS